MGANMARLGRMEEVQAGRSLIILLTCEGEHA